MRISDWSSDVCSSDLKDNRLQTEQKQEDARSKAMKEELEWVRKNPKGRQAKSKARIKAFEELSSQEYQKRSETKELYIPPGPRIGDVVLEVNNLAKKFGERTLNQGVSYSVPRGAIVGLIGANGMGRTQIGSAQCRERMCQTGYTSVGAGTT